GNRVEWRRDPVDGFAFHVDVPNGAKAIDLEFQILTSVDTDQGRIVMAPDLLNLQWGSVALYPSGYFARQIPFEASMKLPEGWQFGGALETASSTNGTTTFKVVNFDTLVDSPLFAGRYLKRFDLDMGGPVPVHLNVVADRADLLDAKPEQIEAHRNLV